MFFCRFCRLMCLFVGRRSLVVQIKRSFRATIYNNCLSGYGTSFIACQEQRCFGNILCLNLKWCRLIGVQESLTSFPFKAIVQRRVDKSRANRIATNIITCKVNCNRSCNTKCTSLCRRVTQLIRCRANAISSNQIQYYTTTCFDHVWNAILTAQKRHYPCPVQRPFYNLHKKSLLQYPPG